MSHAEDPNSSGGVDSPFDGYIDERLRTEGQPPFEGWFLDSDSESLTALVEQEDSPSWATDLTVPHEHAANLVAGFHKEQNRRTSEHSSEGPQASRASGDAVGLARPSETTNQFDKHSTMKRSEQQARLRVLPYAHDS